MASGSSTKRKTNKCTQQLYSLHVSEEPPNPTWHQMTCMHQRRPRLHRLITGELVHFFHLLNGLALILSQRALKQPPWSVFSDHLHNRIISARAWYRSILMPDQKVTIRKKKNSMRAFAYCDRVYCSVAGFPSFLHEAFHPPYRDWLKH